ncbi:hypothetical protein BB560_000302 [Smittium megazygosporum]|uniref:FYVE-type domain-containing protein n=1 Tax=Smittium megazygosporum TaxID=133381 RepID=A0A2T9ZKR4_9FUNG|nr:hypothetical protein BB560_000302 [Smittium megazygosporum]
MKKRNPRVFGSVSLPQSSEEPATQHISSVPPEAEPIETVPESISLSPNLNPIPDGNLSTSSSPQTRPEYYTEYEETSTYTCPICNSFMGTMEQINLHLNTAHFSNQDSPNSNLNKRQPESSENQFDDIADTVLGFFRSTGNKVRGLGDTITSGKLTTELGRLGIIDVDNNEQPLVISSDNHFFESGNQSITQTSIVESNPSIQSNINGLCASHGCNRSISAPNQSFKCKVCKLQFCSVHGVSGMPDSSKASSKNLPLAKFQCPKCAIIDFGSSKDSCGPIRSQTAFFIEKRANAIKKFLLEANRLSQAYSNLHASKKAPAQPVDLSAKKLLGIGIIKDSQRKIEMDIVPWEDDRNIKSCFMCRQPFSQLSNRKHHCRLCGRVVCGKKACSSLIDVPLFDKGNAKLKTTIGTRACSSCIKTLAVDMQCTVGKTKVKSLYDNLADYSEQIESNLMSLKLLLSKLEKTQNEQVQVYKDIIQLPAESDTELRLFKSIRQAVVLNMQLFTVELSAMSQTILAFSEKGNKSLNRNNSVPLLSKTSVPVIPLKSIHSGQAIPINQDESSIISPEATPPPLPIKPDPPKLKTSKTDTFYNIKSFFKTSNGSNSSESTKNITEEELVFNPFVRKPPQKGKIEEQLSILREQRVIVQGYIKQSLQNREWETVRSLNLNLEDLDNEISILEKQL